MTIDETDHEKYLSDLSNIIPTSVISLEKFYDLQDKFIQTTNYKTENSTLNYTAVDMGAEQEPHFINLGVHCSHHEKIRFIKLCKEFKYVFSWKYEDLNTYYPYIFQHHIPLRE